MRPGAIATLVVLVGLTGACGDAGATTGENTGGEPPSTAADINAPETTTPVPTSGRPFAVDLTGVDPCTAIPTDVLAALGSSTAFSEKDQTGPTEYSCSYRDNNSPYGSSLTVDPSKGYEQYSKSGVGVTVTQISVAGFKAYAAEKPGLGGCTVGVDVADSQSLSSTRIGPVNQPAGPLCDKAAAFAAAAINAIKSQ